jgi:hypothetical protein
MNAPLQAHYLLDSSLNLSQALQHNLSLDLSKDNFGLEDDAPGLSHQASKKKSKKKKKKVSKRPEGDAEDDEGMQQPPSQNEGSQANAAG